MVDPPLMGVRPKSSPPTGATAGRVARAWPVESASTRARSRLPGRASARTPQKAEQAATGAWAELAARVAWAAAAGLAVREVTAGTGPEYFMSSTLLIPRRGSGR